MSTKTKIIVLVIKSTFQGLYIGGADGIGVCITRSLSQEILHLKLTSIDLENPFSPAR